MMKERFSVVIGGLGLDDVVDPNVQDIRIDSLSVSDEGKEILKNASLMLSHGKRYGLVGENGTGKSTLLKLLAQRKIPVPNHIDIVLVDQAVRCSDRNDAIQTVVSANHELVLCRKELERLSSDDATEEKLFELYARLQMLGSDVAEARAYKILVGLGFRDDMLACPTKSLSVGWRKRILLAGALFVQPSVLLLDEPTNHLDLEAVLWLQEYLSRWDNTLVVVSHGVDFLNSVCTDIIHLHDHNLHTYQGNFDAFEYDQQAPEAPRKWRDYSVVLDFPEPTELPPPPPPPPLVQLIEVSYCYPHRPEMRLSNVDVGIDMGTRVAVVGPHEVGKSILLKLIAGDLVPSAGEVRRSQKVRIGKYSQHLVNQLPKGETPVQYLLLKHPDQEGCSKQEAVRANLGKFGVPSHKHSTLIAELSAGEKARVVLASISMSKPNILVLDEPTNHLDMQTIDALADALVKFIGGVVLMSNDSRLVSRVCEEEDKSEIWVVQEGAVTFFQGTFEEYKKELKGKIRAEVDDLIFF